MADIACRLSEVVAIYPITPASVMGEHADQWAVDGRMNLWARVPVLHFFDGFHTSHEIRKLGGLSDDTHHALIGADDLAAHRARALNPERPMIRGTSQNPDAFFQRREAVEPFCAAFPDRLTETMARFAELTGRHYALFDVVGDPQADRVVILMGSGADCAGEAVGAKR